MVVFIATVILLALKVSCIIVPSPDGCWLKKGPNKLLILLFVAPNI